MKQFLILAIATGFLFSCKQTKQADKVSTVQYDSLYHPAVFTDAGRMDKIKLALPVIDSIYKKNEERIIFPEFYFGVLWKGHLFIGGIMGLLILKRKFPLLLLPCFGLVQLVRFLRPWQI
mgnify:CR=1 FL=1